MMSIQQTSKDLNKRVSQSLCLLVPKFVADKVSFKEVIEFDSVSHRKCNNSLSITKAVFKDLEDVDRQPKSKKKYHN